MRAAQPPVGPTGPHATGGRDQDLYAAIAAFLGACLENDPQAHVAGLVADTMKRYHDWYFRQWDQQTAWGDPSHDFE
eukprot:9513543-Prorocentrum_lima.AAC.1